MGMTQGEKRMKELYKSPLKDARIGTEKMRLCLGKCGKMWLSPHAGRRICWKCAGNIERKRNK